MTSDHTLGRSKIIASLGPSHLEFTNQSQPPSHKLINPACPKCEIQSDQRLSDNARSASEMAQESSFDRLQKTPYRTRSLDRRTSWYIQRYGTHPAKQMCNAGIADQTDYRWEQHGWNRRKQRRHPWRAKQAADTAEYGDMMNEYRLRHCSTSLTKLTSTCVSHRRQIWPGRYRPYPMSRHVVT